MPQLPERASSVKGEDCAHDEKRFKRTLYGKPFGVQKLDKLRAATEREWRDGIQLKPAAASRTLTALKAALNLAVREAHAPVSLALESRLVNPVSLLPIIKKPR